jgi:hypothetical protein
LDYLLSSRRKVPYYWTSVVTQHQTYVYHIMYDTHMMCVCIRAYFENARTMSVQEWL